MRINELPRSLSNIRVPAENLHYKSPVSRQPAAPVVPDHAWADWFPNDYERPTYFYSTWRSWNGNANVPCFDMTQLDNAGSVVGTTVVSSGDNGLVDIGEFTGENSLFVISRFYNQGNAGADANIDALISSTPRPQLLVGFQDNDGAESFWEQNGKQVARAGWTTSELANFMGAVTTSAYSDYGSGSLSSPIFRFYGMHAIFRRHNETSSGSNLRMGDSNAYPGLRSDSNPNRYRFSMNGGPGKVEIDDDRTTDWLCWVGSLSRDTDNVGVFVRHSIASLQHNTINTVEHNGNIPHSASGYMRLTADLFDFAEWGLWDFPYTSDQVNIADGMEWRDDIEQRILSNAVWQIGGQTFAYDL